MEAVNAFNMELFSMIDMKPPISRAKMMSVTKSAIKAIKLYKHVVQIVEKFIKKCKPELKVPGLYVVDSIVRQSRHQFGVDKDVFGPRFLKNFTDTFQNLCLCPEDDKSKIIRVLNLWQKNGVFDLDIIQPLMDMANGVIVPAPSLEVPTETHSQPPDTSASVVSTLPQLPSSDALAAVAQLFQSPHGQELQRMLQNFQQAEKSQTANISQHPPNPPQVPVGHLNPHNAHIEKRSSLAEKLLDRFDYDDEPEDNGTKDGTAHLLGILGNVSNLLTVQRPNAEIAHPHVMGQSGDIVQAGGMNHVHEKHHIMPDGYRSMNEPYSQLQGNSREDLSMRRDNTRREDSRRDDARRDDRHRGGYNRRSGSRSPRRRRSRSTSRSRRSRHRRSRSRSRERRHRSRSRDRNEREKDRERRQKGLPTIKSRTLSVCTTTLWVGQLDKKTQQSDVMSLLEEFGQIESINMIPPRGCAYIVMVHRQDAYTALSKLSRGSYKVNQKPVKIAWALNKGIKVAHKKFWDVERGVTYVPWDKVKVEELESYREGGVLDTETLNPEWNVVDHKQPAINGVVEGVPADGNVASYIQVPAVQQAAPLGSPPAFPGPIMLSPTSISAGAAPFIPPDLNPANLAAAGSLKPPEEFRADPKGDSLAPSLMGVDKPLGSPTAAVMTLPGAGVMPRPVMAAPVMANPHLPPFLQPPQIMPGGAMFPVDRFRLPLPFPPRGPPYHQPPAMRPEGLENREAQHFRNGRPGFACPPPFQQGRW